MIPTIYTITYNEEVFIQYFIDHYRSKFPGCDIVIYDNMSTDNTVKIANENNCNVISFDTNDKFMDSKHLQIKNNCWKNSKNQWALICDADELVQISLEELIEEDRLGSTIIKFEGYNMVNLEENNNFKNMTNGARAIQYDKNYLFNTKLLTDINYSPGCHSADPKGTIKYSDNVYKACHFKWLNKEYVINRYRLCADRLSEENKKNQWGYHYFWSDEKIIDYMNNIKLNSKKILP